MKSYSLKSLGNKNDYMTILRETDEGYVIRIVRDLDGYDDVVSVSEKVKVEGKKRPQLMDVDHHYQMDKVKYTKYLISFK